MTGLHKKWRSKLRAGLRRSRASTWLQPPVASDRRVSISYFIHVYTPGMPFFSTQVATSHASQRFPSWFAIPPTTIATAQNTGAACVRRLYSHLVPILIHVPIDLRLLIKVRDNRAARGARRQMLRKTLSQRKRASSFSASPY
jgi:hypothetical protein